MIEESADKVWKPISRKQEIFLSLPDDIFEALYGGAAGPGKSEILMMLPIARQFIQHPRFKGILFRRTFPELEREIIPRSYEYYSAAGGKYNDQKKVWDFPTGARIFFGHLEHEQDVRKYDTAEFNYESFDELTSFTEYQYTYLSATRCRSSDSRLPAIVRNGTNPGNVGHAWVKKRWKIDQIPSGTVQKDKVTGLLRIFIQAFLTDNPKIDPGYSQRLELLPEAEKRAKKYGDWSIFEGQVFGEFRIDPLPDEPDNARHVISPILIPEWWPKILAIDWGFAAFAYSLWGAIAPNGKVYCYREHAVKKQYIEEWVADVARQSQGENIVDIIIDPSSKQNRGQPKTIFQQVYEALPKGLSDLLRPSDNDRIGGKALIHEYLRWNPRPPRFIETSYDPKFAEQVLKLGGIEKYNEYLNYFRADIPEEAENLPKLQIFDTCKTLIETIPQCVYDEHKKEDVKEFNGDDPYDTLRYLLKAVHNYTEQASEEQQKRKRIEEVNKRFEQTKDHHNFYMNMRRLEYKEKLNSGPIQRYSKHTGRVKCPTLVQG